MEPSLEEFGGQSLLPYRYCIDTNHRCHGVTNHVSPYSLIHSIDTEGGKCLVNSVNLRKVEQSDKELGNVCLKLDDDDEDVGMLKHFKSLSLGFVVRFKIWIMSRLCIGVRHY